MTVEYSKIPIANIFYMLAYAYDIDLEWARTRVDRADYETLWQLLVKLLHETIENVLKQGLGCDYQNQEDTIPGVKGRLDAGNTYSSLAWDLGKAVCIFDEYIPDVPMNQVLKETIYLLLISENPALDEENRTLLKKQFRKFAEISFHPEETKRKLASIKLQRHQRHYKLPHALCRFIRDNTVFNEKSGNYEFVDFQRDRKRLAKLFETFIRKFYAKMLLNWTVSAEEIKWKLDSGESILLPGMHTDISLKHEIRKIIIETKFYEKALLPDRWGGCDKFNSKHLYQLFAYLCNLEGNNSKPLNKTAEGMLLYPVNTEIIPKLDVVVKGHRMRVESIDLNQDWRCIEKCLMELIGIDNESPEMSSAEPSNPTERLVSVT